MNELQLELAELIKYFEVSDIDQIIATIDHGSMEEIEALIYECNERITGRQNG